MAQNLTEDLNIVANSNLEIELLDGDLNIIQKLDDEPNDVGGMTSAELKATFDKSGNIIKRYINETLIPAILEDDATDAARAAAEAQREANETQRIENENARIAAEQARVSETNGVVAQATEQAEAAAESARQAAQAILGQIVDGSLTEEKLAAEVQAAINRAKAGGEIDTLLAGKVNGGKKANWVVDSSAFSRNGVAYCRDDAGTVYVTIFNSLLTDEISTWSNKVICTLPEGFRPTRQISVPLRHSYNKCATISIDTSGQLTVSTGGDSVLNTADIAFFISFPTA